MNKLTKKREKYMRKYYELMNKAHQNDDVNKYSIKAYMYYEMAQAIRNYESKLRKI